MFEAIELLAKIIDYPVTVAAFVWALRMIRENQIETARLLRDCLQEQYDKD